MREICLSAEHNKHNDSRVVFYCKTRIASKNIIIEANYKRSLYKCKDYLSDFSKPDIVVRASYDEVIKELERFPLFINTNSFDSISTDLSSIESNIINLRIAKEMLRFNTILIHGSAVAVDNKCYIFAAPSGTGKTTHTYNWLKTIPGTIVINGDKPLVDVKNRIVYGTPWSGKESLNTNTSCKLAGIISLERGDYNSIYPISFKEFLPIMLKQVYLPPERDLIKKGSQLIGLLQDVPCYRLICNMNAESALIAYRGVLM